MRNRWRRQVSTLVFSLTAALGVLWPGVSKADYVGNKYTDPTTGQVLEYNVYVPAGYDQTKKYPLMVFLHAANTNQIPPPRTLSSDGVGWTGTFLRSPYLATDPSFFMIPISQTNMSGWGEATQPISTPEKFEGELTIKVLKSDVMTKYNIDPNRLYITGPSMGGRGTWDILRRYPTLFAAAAPAAAPASPDDAALFLNQNIWAICGEVDPIVQGERDAVTAIRKLGGNPIYTELAGHGHDSWRWVYPDPQFVPWIYAQRLGIPWWTVSKPPVAPFTGGTPAATLSANQPVTMPPANLPTSFGGAPGSVGGGAGAPGAPGGGGGAAVASGTGGKPGGGAGGGTVGANGAGGSSASGTGGSSVATPAGTGGEVLTGTGGAASSPSSSSGGAPGSTTPGGAATGGSGVATTGTGGGAASGPNQSGSGSPSSGGGCSYGGRATRAGGLGLLAGLALLASRRRRA
jgi:poly(3-hydroxybutyrate) depolymerase